MTAHSAGRWASRCQEKEFEVQSRTLLTGLVVTALTLLSSLTLPAGAQVTSTGPFTGSASETWESFPNYQSNPSFYQTDPTAIFGGAATISNDYMAVYQPSAGASFGLGSSGPAQVSDGTKGMGVDRGEQTTTIQFASPVSAFGGYWGAATFGSGTTVTVSFFDVFASLIDTQTFNYSRDGFGDGLLEWHGWNSTTGIGAITYSGDYVVNDGLQINAANVSAVPEPSSMALLLMGGLPLAKKLRRRRAAV